MDMRREGRKPNRGGQYPQRLRLFRHDLLERLTVVSPRTFVVIWTMLLLLVLWAGWGTVSAPMWIGLVAGGLLIWSLFEYAMHRYLFHLELDSELGRWLGFVMHGNHHADPNDPHRSMMPPIVSVTWSAAIWGIFALLFGPVGTVIFLGFTIGYVTYDSIHYACHQLRPRSRLLRALRRHHLRHHYGRSKGNYAITTILWDRVFGSHLTAKVAATPQPPA
jgi:sterol desaturase/sphingolipid hydroxylase (fatty acid hydroxylase superfamily)